MRMANAATRKGRARLLGPILLALGLLALAGCGDNLAVQQDAAAQPDAPITEGGTDDGGTCGALPCVGMRWTNAVFTKPEAIADVMNLQGPPYIHSYCYLDSIRPSTDFYVILASVGTPGTPDYAIYGGTGTRTSDSTPRYDFESGFAYGNSSARSVGPVPAIANGDTGDGEAGYVTSAAADKKFDWAFPLWGYCATGTVDVGNVIIRFSAGGDGLIKSDMNGGMYGSFSGCVTREAADAYYVDILAQSLGALLDVSGANPDCDPEGGTNLIGYTLATTWEADEQVNLQWPSAQLDRGGRRMEASTPRGSDGVD